MRKGIDKVCSYKKCKHKKTRQLGMQNQFNIERLEDNDLRIKLNYYIIGNSFGKSRSYEIRLKFIAKSVVFWAERSSKPIWKISSQVWHLKLRLAII